MLFLISTPIGNLEDFSFRAVKAIESCDYLLCEDTRHSQKLLAHYELRKPLKSYHQFNEAARQNGILEDLKSGKTIGLLSDAGTPGIADPGMRLVKKCREEGLEISAIPGACAAIVALVASGFTTERFQFVGFLPFKKGKREKLLVETLSYPGTTIAYESPHRIVSTLEILAQIAPQVEVIVARELTKKFETYHRGTAPFLLEGWRKTPPKGEMVLLLPGSQ